MKKTTLLLLLYLLLGIVRAQDFNQCGSPFIQNYIDKDYNTDSPQNWTLVQDKRGLMYFGNTEGVLEYDGRNWSLIKTPNNSVLWALAIDEQGTIYAGAINEFGYLAANKNGKLDYVSYLSKIPKNDRASGIIIDICVTSEGVFFIGNSNIYWKKGDSFTVIRNSYNIQRGYVVNNRLYIVQKDNGIYVFDNGKLVKLPGSELLKSNYKEYAVLPYSEYELLIGTRDNGFFLYNLKESAIERFKTQVESYTNANLLQCGIKLSNGNFAFGTLTGGIIIMNRAGNLVRVINKNRGLQSNGIYSLYQDSDKNLWAGMVNGIAKIEIQSPFTLFDEKNGLEGLNLSTVEFKGKRYFGTTNGVYYMPEYKMKNTNDRFFFKHINNTEVSCWSFYQLDNMLLAPGPSGILEIKDTIAVKLNNIGIVVEFAQSKKFPDYLFVGLRPGLAAIKLNRNNGKTTLGEITTFKEFNTFMWDVVPDGEGNLWCGDHFNGISHLEFPEPGNINKYNISYFDTTSGLPRIDNNYIFNINDKILVGTANGIYHPEKVGGSNKYVFKPDADFEWINKQGYDIKHITLDKNGQYWLKSDVFDVAILKENKEVYTLYDKPFKKIGYAFIFYVENDGDAWICGNHGIYRYESNVQINEKSQFPTLLRKVVAGADSVIFAGTFTKGICNGDGVFPVSCITPESSYNVKLPYNLNSLKFNFSIPFYENEKFNEYSYILEGFDKTWSEWNTAKYKEYTNLKEGTYTFKVKGRNLYGTEGAEISYKFTIRPPWYRTYIAYAIYFVLMVVLVVAIIRIYTLRLVKKNVRLEKLVKERTLEVEQQKEELQTQAENLEITNQELEKLSIVASETENAILIMDADGNIEWVNDALKRIYGYSMDMFRSEPYRNIRSVSSSQVIIELLDDCIRNKKAITYENLTETPDGRKVWAQTTLTPILDADGKIKKLVAIDTDISKVKEAEEAIRQQNEEIRAQRELLSKANNELKRHNRTITDSITYARRIQEAILPSQRRVKSFFPDSFIFYKPRNIVSGDFYWMNQIEGRVFFAAVDCTGHGVPGAFMSMIGNTLLNELILEKKMQNPADILAQLSLRIIAALDRTRDIADAQTDGMDIMLCCWDRKKMQVQMAGANLTSIFSSKDGLKLIQGDIYAIGDYFSINNNIVYTNHTFPVVEGDCIYLYTDGYQDQYDNNDEKKFLATNFENFIGSITQLEMQEQLSLVSSNFEKWKGGNSQTDDVLVIGVRFKNSC